MSARKLRNFRSGFELVLSANNDIFPELRRLKWLHNWRDVLWDVIGNPIYLPGFFKSCHRLPETKRHSSLFLLWSGSKFLVVLAACTPYIHVFLGRPLFLLSRGIQSITNLDILSSGILLTWPYHCSLFFSMTSMMSGFPFTHIISFTCSFFILSILDFLAEISKPLHVIN